MRPCLLTLVVAVAAIGCDDAADPPSVRDAGAADRGIDAAQPLDGGAPADARVEAGPLDAGPDGAPLDAALDGTPPDTCALRPSPRSAPAWRVSGCDWLTEGDGARVPRALVVSGDSLLRNARTPLHTEVEYAQLAALDVDWIWLLLTWDGVAPLPDTLNGAYMGRVCQQIEWAAGAGLPVVLSMHQERWGPALGGHGAPPWATPPNLDPVPAGSVDATALDQAWAGFWTAPGRRDAFVAAWTRLLDTCAASEGVIGVQPLADPRGAPADVAALFRRIRAEAEARWGPLLLFVDGAHPGGDAPDTVWAPTAWMGRGPSAAAPDLSAARTQAQRLGLPLFVRGVALTDAGLGAAEAQGAGWAGWHDGFGLDPLALRDMDGIIGPGGPLIRDRIRPLVVGGAVLGFGPTPGGFSLRWRADGRNAGLTVLAVGPVAPVVELIGAGPEAFSAHDPLSGELSVFVQGDHPLVEVRVAPGDGMEGDE